MTKTAKLLRKLATKVNNAKNKGDEKKFGSTYRGMKKDYTELDRVKKGQMRHYLLSEFGPTEEVHPALTTKQ